MLPIPLRNIVGELYYGFVVVLVLGEAIREVTSQRLFYGTATQDSSIMGTQEFQPPQT